MSGPSGPSVWGLFEAAARDEPRREFLHVPLEACHAYSAAAITLSYAAARERSSDLALELARAGFGAGHRVALALDNRPDFFLHFLALNQLGMSVVPLNAGMSAQELHFVLQHSDAALVVTHADHAARMREALPPGTALKVRAAAGARGDEIARPVKDPSAAEGEAALLYTSGTTGKPKGCILGNEYFLEAGRLYTNLGGYCRFDGTNDRLATPLPVSHMNALAVSFTTMVMARGCLIQLDRFHPSSWWRSLESSRASAFHYLGVMPAMLLKAPAASGDSKAGQLRFGFGAGADPRHQAAFEARFGVPLIEAWAMTETGAGAWITANLEPRHVGQRCFGKAPQGLAYRIVDDHGADVAPGVAGELLVRRADGDPRQGFFRGYYRDPSATEEAWSHGWFHTGDLVRVDAEGSFFFVDRSKNVVRRSGENIAAVEVESVLGAHPDVIGSAVCPVSDEIRGEEVFAFVLLRAGVEPDLRTAQALQAHCLAALAYYKAPGYVAFRADLPQTASQKLARGAIKALAASVLAGESSAGAAGPRDGAFDLRHLKKRRG
jgi:acyl-coenzyme A synthetase/AMP-(fatty) acid ligase